MPDGRRATITTVETWRPVQVLQAMADMFASGDPPEAAAVVADDYLDHQGLGTGPIRGVDGSPTSYGLTTRL